MDHPITPPPELMQQWVEATRSNDCIGAYPQDYEQHVATQAARWGADQELEACCEWIHQNCGRWDLLAELRAARRPKPPSLREQALEALKHAEEGWRPVPADCDIIRRALEALPDE